MIDVSRRTSNGEGNFNFATIFNCPPDIPFFPAGELLYKPADL